MNRHTGSTACLDIYAPHNPNHWESPHRCRCLRMPGHGGGAGGDRRPAHVSDYEPHQCRCGQTWKD